MIDDYFPWPSTEAPASQYGFQGDFFFYDKGLLQYVGYSVGHDGEPLHVRREILDCVFHNKLPNVNSLKYMQEWGHPKTPARLKKMANAIAAFTRLSKNKSNDYGQAIDDWETDLDYLYKAYYVDKFNFAWPTA